MKAWGTFWDGIQDCIPIIVGVCGPFHIFLFIYGLKRAQPACLSFLVAGYQAIPLTFRYLHYEPP